MPSRAQEAYRRAQRAARRRKRLAQRGPARQHFERRKRKQASQAPQMRQLGIDDEQVAGLIIAGMPLRKAKRKRIMSGIVGAHRRRKPRKLEFQGKKR